MAVYDVKTSTAEPSPGAVVRRLCDLVKAKDLAGLADLFADDAVYHNVGTPATNGREAIIAVLRGLFEGFDGFDWFIDSLAVEGDVVLTERVDELVKGQVRAAIPVMGAFVVRHGRIESWRDYYDPVLARRLIQGESLPELVPPRLATSGGQRADVPETDLADQLARLTAETRTLKDIEEIRMLRMAYHEMINERRSDQIPTLFVPGGTIDFGYMCRSLESLARSSARAELMQQMIHNHAVQVDGDRGTGFAYQEGRGVFHGTAYVYGGRYDDVYVRTPDGWRFESMRFAPTMFVPFDQGWADPATRFVDPHAGRLVRDGTGDVVAAAGSPADGGQG